MSRSGFKVFCGLLSFPLLGIPAQTDRPADSGQGKSILFLLCYPNGTIKATKSHLTEKNGGRGRKYGA